MAKTSAALGAPLATTRPCNPTKRSKRENNRVQPNQKRQIDAVGARHKRNYAGRPIPANNLARPS
eukprot:7144834-Lingulodinium_polyedra.AAC.1